ncbi:hypothetical protein EAE32_06465 [Kocuria tytonicola]|uniref:Uncharacterized protein n=1 Tax=Kocuria tytonicola TaxID=2055946 RepID=A0A3L9L8U1_9MICC|nr:hypothetical protein [Kocuria tytonicola]RLY94778.1 hypothetical protein EAE32_06465 [Kocuria tytonicola]
MTTKPRPMPASQWDDYLAALCRVTAQPHTEGMVELCRTRYGATTAETTAALAAIRETEEGQ